MLTALLLSQTKNDCGDCFATFGKKWQKSQRRNGSPYPCLLSETKETVRNSATSYIYSSYQQPSSVLRHNQMPLYMKTQVQSY
jgi:hypothetical protein